jgi:hypothetical protein
MNQRDAENLATLRRSIRETDVSAAIRDYLVLHGAVVIRINSGAVKDGDRHVAFNRWHAPGVNGETAGVADLIVLYRGQVFAVECKRPVGGRVSPAQVTFREAWEAAGGWHIVASSIEDIQEELGL